jgi:hypothetical protein
MRVCDHFAAKQRIGRFRRGADIDWQARSAGSVANDPTRTLGGLFEHELLLAFWASIGFKPRDFMTIGMNEKRTTWHCRVLNRLTHPA